MSEDRYTQAYGSAVEQMSKKIELRLPQPKIMSLEEEMAAIDEPAAEPWFRVGDWGVEKYLGKAPQVDFLVEGVLPRGVPGVIAGMGAVGKSMLCLELCIRIAAGPGLSPSYALGGRVGRRGRTVFVTAEDSYASVHRRLNQIVTQETEKAKLINWFYVVPLSVVGMRPLMTVVRGEYKMTDAWYELVAELKAIPELSLVVLDPLASLVAADMNDPGAAAAFWAAVNELCEATGATVLLTHHMRKDGAREVDGPMAARELIRGSTSIVDSSRFAYALFLPSAKVRDSIEQATGETYDAMSIVQGCVVKSNDIGMTPVRTFLRDPNSGLLVDSTERVFEELEDRKYLSDEQIMQTFGTVSSRWSDDDPFSHHAAAKSRYLGTWMCAHFDITKDAAKDYISQWLGEGRLSKEPHPTIRRAQGLRFNP